MPNTTAHALRKNTQIVCTPFFANRTLEVAERVNKTTSVPGAKKKKETPMKLHGDLEIPQPEVLENHTTPTNFSTSPPRWG
jgi:hypothetical protein